MLLLRPLKKACAVSLSGNWDQELALQCLAFQGSKQASLSCFKVIWWIQAGTDKHVNLWQHRLDRMCCVFSAYSVQLKAGALFGIGPQSLLPEKVHNSGYLKVNGRNRMKQKMNMYSDLIEK